MFRVISGKFLSVGFELLSGQELILLRWVGVIKVGTQHCSCPESLIPFGNRSWVRHSAGNPRGFSNTINCPVSSPLSDCLRPAALEGQPGPFHESSPDINPHIPPHC